MPEYIWTTEDYEGVEVALEHSVWHGKILHPIRGHLEVKEYLDEIRLSIHSPEAVFASIRDPRSKLFYRSGLTIGKIRQVLDRGRGEICQGASRPERLRQHGIYQPR